MTHKPQYTHPAHEHIDEWHHHTAAEGQPQVEHGAKPNTVLLFIAFVGSLAFVGLAVLATYLYFSTYTSDLRTQRIENTAMGKDYRAYRDRVQQDLQRGYVWLSDDAARAGNVTLPLDTARQRVIAKYQK